MPCKLGLMIYRAQRAASGLVRKREAAKPDREAAAPAGHGHSALSPGHLKRTAGARSARDFAPGRINRPVRGASSS